MSARVVVPLMGLIALSSCGGAPDAAPTTEPTAQLVSGKQAVEQAFVPTIDPATMTDAQIARVVPTARRCAFRYTEDSDPVVATDGTRGVVKINGDLVALAPASPGDPAAGGQLVADGVRLTVQPLRAKGRDGADLRFEVASGPGLSVDYRGFYRCTG